MNWDEYNVSPVWIRPGYIIWLIYQEAFPLKVMGCYKKLVPQVRWPSRINVGYHMIIDMTQTYLQSVFFPHTMALPRGGHMQDDIHVGLTPNLGSPKINRFGDLEAVPRVDQLDQLVLQAIVMRFCTWGEWMQFTFRFPQILVSWFLGRWQRLYPWENDSCWQTKTFSWASKINIAQPQDNWCDLR